MKRGWAAVALLAVMVGLSLWHVEALGGLAEGLNRDLEQAERLAETGDWTSAHRLTQEAEKRWAAKGFYLHITLDHAVTDQVSTSFAETLEFLECQEAGEYSAANARLMEQLRLLSEMERPLVENLL